MEAIAAQMCSSTTTTATHSLGVVRDQTVTTPAADFQGRTLAQVMTGTAGVGTSATLTSGVAFHSLPKMDTVTPSIRQAIVEGRDINLATLLIQGYEFGEVRSVNVC
jgi:hypothetical protein